MTKELALRTLPKYLSSIVRVPKTIPSLVAPLRYWQTLSSQKKYFSTFTQTNLSAQLRQAIQQSHWTAPAFDHPTTEAKLLSYYQEEKINANVFSILNARLNGAKVLHSGELSPAQIPIYPVSTQMQMVEDYFLDEDHRYRLRFISQILQDELAVEAFLIFLMKKFKENNKANESLYFFPYKHRKKDFSGFLYFLLENDTTYHQYTGKYENSACAHMFFPVRERDWRWEGQNYTGIFPSLNLAQFVYNALSEFMRLQTGNADYAAVNLTLALKSLKAADVGAMHGNMQHPVGIKTDDNPTDKADGHDTSAICYIWHELFHAYRYCLQPGFSYIAQLVDKVVYPFYAAPEHKHLLESCAFSEATNDMHAGKLAQVLTDQEKVKLTTNTMESLYAGLFDPIINGPYSQRERKNYFETFNCSLTEKLFKEVIKACYEKLTSTQFSELVQIILSKNAFNSYIATFKSIPYNQMQLAVIALFKQMINNAPGTDLANKLQNELNIFKAEVTAEINSAVKDLQCVRTGKHLDYKNYADFFNKENRDTAVPLPETLKIRSILFG